MFNFDVEMQYQSATKRNKSIGTRRKDGALGEYKAKNKHQNAVKSTRWKGQITD